MRPQGTQGHDPDQVPLWLPDAIRSYLAHTEGGQPIRVLARRAGCHPSTVLRQVRRTETRRDDPLVDTGLDRLGQLWRRAKDRVEDEVDSKGNRMPMTRPKYDAAPDSADSLRVLRALTEPGTILVIATGVEDAVVVHDAGGNRPVRRAVLSRVLAEDLALRGLIAGRQTGRIARYAITAAGRVEVGRMMAQRESRRVSELGLADDAGKGANVARFPDRAGEGRAKASPRAAGADAPLHVLARRRRPDGTAYIGPELVAAALRFREAYEVASLGAAVTRDWGRLIAGRVDSTGAATGGRGATRRLEAEQSLTAAIRALGPELAETAIMAICEEQGMETVERALDFPARSGKIVLRIALNTLARHYDARGADGYEMIY
jgi:hypothetical protein